MDQVCRTMGAPSAFNAQITAFSVAANPDYTILDQMKVNDPSSYISGLEASIRSWNNFKLCRHQPDCMVDGSPVAAGKNLALPQSGLDACKKFNGTAFSCVAATSQPGAMSIDCASLPVGTGRSMCNVVNADGFDLVAFNKYYTDSHLTSRDDVAEVIALAKGYKGSPSGVDACVDYVKGYVAGDSVTPGVWSWSRYRMLVHCKLALSAYNSTQLINDLTAWQLADCSGAASCDAVSDPDLKVFCTGSPDPYPWPLSSSVP